MASSARLGIALLLAAAALPGSALGQSDPCPAGWTPVVPPFEGGRVLSCAKRPLEKATWYTAKAVCISEDAKLMEINSPRENEFAKYFKVMEDPSAHYWTGGNDLATPGRWVWASLGYRIYPFVNWAGDDMADANGHCIALHPNTFRWVKSDCAKEQYYICEKKVPVLVTTTTSSTTQTTSTTTKPSHGEISFSGNGHCTLDQKLISHVADMNTQIDLELSTWSEEGLILWQGQREVGWGTENPNYLAVGLSDGYLTFSVNDVTVRSTRRVNDGVAHKAALRMNQQQLGLSLDDGSGVFKMLTPPLDLDEIKEFDILLGGVDSDEYSVTGGLFHRGFSGCVHAISVINKPQSNIADTNRNNFGGRVNFADSHLNKNCVGVDITDVCALPPGPTARPPAVTTTTSPSTTTSSTRRPPFVTTTTTTTARPPAPAKDVAFDGRTSLSLPNDFLPLDKLSSEVSANSLRSVRVDLRLTTIAKEGLILWFGERSKGILAPSEGFFMAIAISNGFLQLRYDFGGGLKTMSTQVMSNGNGFVSDGRLRSVAVEIREDNAVIELDQRRIVGESFFQDDVFPVDNLQIGGAYGNISSATHGLYSQGFVGCLHSMSITEENLDGQRETREVALERDAQRPYSFSSTTCSAVLRTTTTTTSTTTPARRPMSTTTKPWPPVAEPPCLHKEVAFASTSFVELHPRLISRVPGQTELNITMHFSTRSANGLLMWKGAKQEKKHWLAIAVKEGFLEYHIWMGAGNYLFVRSLKKVNDGRKHTAVFLKHNTMAQIRLDQDAPANANIRANVTLNVDKHMLFIGGLEGDISSTAGDDVASEGYDGCIHFFSIWHKSQDGSKHGAEIDFSGENNPFVVRRKGLSCSKMCSV